MVTMICPRCEWIGPIRGCVPDVDGHGSLGCPECFELVEEADLINEDAGDKKATVGDPGRPLDH